jgi:hypothetical protein
LDTGMTAASGSGSIMVPSDQTGISVQLIPGPPTTLWLFTIGTPPPAP